GGGGEAGGGSGAGGRPRGVGRGGVRLTEPQVLLLDEPASGLDPRARIEMRGLLKELRNMGKTILVSSHILPELADICNKIGIIERGRLLFDGDVESAIRQVRQRHVMRVAVGNNLTLLAKEQLEAHPDVDTVEIKEDDSMLVTRHEGIASSSLISTVSTSGWASSCSLASS